MARALVPLLRWARARSPARRGCPARSGPTSGRALWSGSCRIGLHPPILLIQLLRTDHVALDRESAELSLQRKTKPARLIDRIHFRGLALKFGRPMQKRLLPKTLRRLGIAPAHLLDHHVKILVHINSQLDRSSAAIKLAAGFLV